MPRQTKPGGESNDDEQEREQKSSRPFFGGCECAANGVVVAGENEASGETLRKVSAGVLFVRLRGIPPRLMLALLPYLVADCKVPI